jgi:mono/diheme cytochrome c family protein
VLPSNYDTITRISLPFVFLLAAAQALFFWNVMQTLRGKGGVATFDERGIPEPSKRSKGWSVHTAEGAVMLVAVLLGMAFAAGGYVVGREHGRGGGSSTTIQTSTGGVTAVTGDAKAGAEVFASAGCGGCHTLSAAGSTGTVGPSLDGLNVPEALVRSRVTNGKGAMPPFGDLSQQQIADVAAYIHASSEK